MDTTPWGTGAVLRLARHYLIPSLSLPTYYAAECDGRPMSLHLHETWVPSSASPGSSLPPPAFPPVCFALPYYVPALTDELLLNVY